jgi:diguanylate cyclase (GGDEF)-like protein
VKPFERRMLATLLSVVLALSVGGAVMLNAVGALSEASLDVQRTQSTLRHLSSMLAALTLAQGSQRDFLLNGEMASLEDCQDALFTVEADLRSLRTLAAQDGLAGRLAPLEPLLVRQIEFYKRTFEARRRHGSAAASALLRREGTGATLERIQQKAQAILAEEQGALERRFALLEARLGYVKLWVAVCGLAAAALLAEGYRRVRLEMRQRIKVTARLERSLQELNHLADLVEALQASQTVEEVCQTAGAQIQQLFEGLSGGLALYDASHEKLDLRYAFGDLGSLAASFSPPDCWALRRGQAHLDDGAQGMACAHLHADPSWASFCVPLSAQGVPVGLLSLLGPGPDSLDERRRKLALVAAEQLSLALANLGLRDRLKEQSILDPLTGLFNRRYMQESFERERERHHERRRVFGLLMADIDHFKRFNDQHGHDAGDHVLRQIAGALQRSLRPGDILCRYGGEELVVLLPEADLAQSLRCAEHCRKAVEGLDLSYQGKALGTVTLSLGVAAYPADGDDVEALIKKADERLYQAKQSGRNRVVSAEPDGKRKTKDKP